MRTQLLAPYHAYSLLFVWTVCGGGHTQMHINISGSVLVTAQNIKDREAVWKFFLTIIFSYIKIFIKENISVCLHYYNRLLGKI